MLTFEDRGDGLFLQRSEPRPAQRVDDMVLDSGMEAVEADHKSSSISSGSFAARALRSTSVSSESVTVSA